MKKLTLICSALIASLVLLPSASLAQSKTQKAKDAPAATTDTPKAAKTAATNAPSATAIADAKSKGMVWVNTDSGIYHKDGEFYGKTKEGKFMTEADAQKAGFRAAKTGAVKTAKTTTKKKS